MRYVLMACLLIASSVWAAQEALPPARSTIAAQQPRSSADDDQGGLPASAAKVPPETAVITMKGLCGPANSGSPQSCVTGISRAQFEKLANAILASQSRVKVRQLAKSYPDMLALAQVAENRGLEKDERVQQRLAFARLQILSQELLRQIDQETANIPQNEIEAYYKSHSERYETASIDRIYVPLRKNQEAGSEAEMKEVAEKLRARATAGEDFLTLQKEAFTAAGMTDVPPNPSLGQLRRNDLPPAHASAFDLNTSEISQVLSDSTGNYVYKIESKHLQTLAESQDDIRRVLRREKRQKAIEEVHQGVSATLNSDYFGSDDPADAPSTNSK